MSPVNKGNGVRPGEICFSCGYYLSKTCPFKNHLKSSTLEFTTNRVDGLCLQYMEVEEDLSNVRVGENENKMIKNAALMKDSELNIELFKKIRALKEKEQKKLYVYWEYLFPKEYAADMVTNNNESIQHDNDSKGKLESQKTREERKKDLRKNKFTDNFRENKE
jgi:hypothetical protein